MTHQINSSIVVVGSGIAGMIAALQLSSFSVILITQGKLGQQTSSILAQGGIASAYYEDDDYASHIQDTLYAGAGLNDPNSVHEILSMGKEAIDLLKYYQVKFDKSNNGEINLGLEAAHTSPRIFHVNGDATGRGIVNQLCKALQSAAHITVMEEAIVKQLLVDENQITGLVAEKADRSFVLDSSHIILATGGIGGLYNHSTNPIGNFGQGIALAANVGAILADLEFIQFHPTALDHVSFPKVLISEAVRGEGAILVNERNERFLDHIEGKELAPRDVVARLIFQEIQRGGKVFLDATRVLGKRFSARFPTIDFLCKQVGINPATDLMPVKPVEHFHMGGIATNPEGKTSVKGLWAIGECASTGLHGANRLASNSLLEGAVMAIKVAKSIVDNFLAEKQNYQSYTKSIISFDTRLIRPIMQSCVGIIRDEYSLKHAIQKFISFINTSGELNYPAQTAFMISMSALLRQESRGAHTRSDYPNLSPNAQRSFITYKQARVYAEQFKLY